MMQIVLLICLAAVVGIDAQADCTGYPDGPCCAGCQAYTYCEGGNGTHIECPAPDYVYNELIGECARADETPPPCGKFTDCAQLPDLRFPDMTPGIECEYYFTCLDGVNMGMHPCNTPGVKTLVFHFSLQVCDYREDTPEPCGTEPPPSDKDLE